MNYSISKIISLLFLFMALSSCSDKPYVIVQIADAQLGYAAAVESQQTGKPYVNDMTYEAGYLRKSVEYINKKEPDVVVFTGDQVNYSDNEEQWAMFTDIISEINDSIKVLHVPGNHDVVLSDKRVDPSPFTSRFGPDKYVYETEDVRLVAINTNLIKYSDPSEREQFQWLKAVLADDEKKTLLFGHHPFFMTDINEDDGYFQIQKAKRRKYFNMFADKGVRAVYAGHRHENSEGVYRNVPMKTTTSVAYQIGESVPSVRVITIRKDKISDKMVSL